MRIGILSDTHDEVTRTAGAVALLAAHGAEALIHCGDLTRPSIVHAMAETGLPCYYVFGNCDFDFEELERAIAATGGVSLGWGGELTLGGKRIALTHGHRADEFRRLLKANPDYLLSGHTHQLLNERDGSIRRINPGALHRARQWTVASLDLARDVVEFHTVR